MIAALLLSLCACAGPKAAPETAQNTQSQTAEINTQVETQTQAANESLETEAPEVAEQKPAEQKPEEEKPAEEQPQATEEQTAEEQPVENTPAPAEKQTPTTETPQVANEQPPAEHPQVEEQKPPVETPQVTEQKPAEPYSIKTESTVLTVRGSELAREWHFSLAELQSLGGQFSGEYFSRGKDPQEMTTAFAGIKVQYLIESVVGVSSYKKAVFTASDGYAASFSRSAVNASYINENVPGSSLPMIIAWAEDGAFCPLRLVMGQQIEGEYNRTNWVSGVITIEIKAG